MSEMVEMKTLTIADTTFEVIDAKARSEITKLLTNIPTSARIGEVTLLTNEWVGSASPYSQVVNIDGVTENSQVDLTPSVEQLAIFHEKDLGFVTENEGGVVTVYAIGQKPLNDYTIQVTITEVAYEQKNYRRNRRHTYETTSNR